MASRILSRSRGAVPVKSNSKETGIKLEENLNIFKSDRFDADAFVNSKCHSLNEKEIRQLCSYLLDLKKASADEMRRSVYANYTALIRTSKEISDLESELLSIRNLLSTQTTLIHGLTDGIHMESLPVTVQSGSFSNGSFSSADVDSGGSSDLENWLTEFPDIVDVLLAERRLEEVLSILDEGERVSSEAKRKKSLNPVLLSRIQTVISKCRQRLANQLAETALQPTTHGFELRAAVTALKRLGDGPRAHSILLQAHYQKLYSNLQNLRTSNTAAISQMVFSVIAQTATDSTAVFGNEPGYTSELVIWATKVTEEFAVIVKRHAFAGGLRAVAECVQIALGHCSLLESRGLTLCPVLLRLFRPCVDQAVDSNLKRIEESVAALVAVDDWNLSSSLTSYQHKLSSSAQRFYSMVQDFFEDVGPLLTMQLGSKMLDKLFHVFNSYISLLIKALPGSIDEELYGNKIVKLAETESQQMALLSNASLLADELLPRAVTKLTPEVQTNYNNDPSRRNHEQSEWKRRIASTVDRLKDSFCRQHALDLIFNEDGGSYLTAEMYINMDESVEEIEWFPSPLFQELYKKLYRMSAISTEMFVGRERFSTLLLMRLTETVILWLSEDQTFWDEIEQGPVPLGPRGIQQFYLDMKFVISFASQGRYLSRNLNRVVNEIINKALVAFSATGVDPYSVFPEDEWFGDICQDAIDSLSAKQKLANGERVLNSPTASVSAQSISSIRSHGSL